MLPPLLAEGGEAAAMNDGWMHSTDARVRQTVVASYFTPSRYDETLRAAS
ncbi:predicted protein [Plenodomus lingam JN3]|uniref:Uncharacterized protein n=1 Tax=Leptosphaeria maculans (strain JN3 / isolate v23.1.3 / race Av1-4-5-6-7-8) TaxID=985895 RepID=E5A7I7_LEPMJ|nr:predicted protein [Plenodomus lingam JN3]CBX99582.1 predicted protein [Plenodomus lingam JN3]